MQKGTKDLSGFIVTEKLCETAKDFTSAKAVTG